MSWTWGPSNWLWQVVHAPAELLNATAAKQWYAEQARQAIATAPPSNWFVHGIQATICDVVGGYIPGRAATQGQALAQLGFTIGSMGFGAVGTGLGVARSFCGVPINIAEGNNLAAALNALSLCGTQAAIRTDLLSRAADQAVRLQQNALSMGQFQSANAFSNIAFVRQLGAFDYGLASYVLSTPGRLRAIYSALTWKEGNAPTVGGILFENCDAVLTDLEEITGAYWDARNSSLVLVGKNIVSGRAMHGQLPAMDRDHLSVALRASLAAQPIGVSIDPPSEYREGIKRGVNPPDGTPMLVSYLGGTEGTLFGAIMFEADRLLKCLDKGVHNESRKPVRATVSGFTPLVEMIHPSDGRPANVWHRFWFVIDRVELKHDAASDAIAFGDVRLKILTETELDGQPKGQYVDPADEAFTRHLTEHYDEYAKDFPILARLKELAKVAALAKFLVNQKVPLDLGALFETHAERVDTPSTTPGISVTSSNVDVRQEGNVICRRTVSLFGGVDMDPDPDVLPDDGTAKRLRKLAESKRLGESVRSWKFGTNETSTALAMRLGPLQSPCRKVYDDHHFEQSNGSDLLRLRRAYDLEALRPGDFGPAWFLWVPFSITVVCYTSRKRPEVLTQREMGQAASAPVLVLHDHISGTSGIYRETNRRDPKGQSVFCRVSAQTLKKGCTSFQYDPSDEIITQTGGFLMRRGSREYCFDTVGHLSAVRERGREVVRYRRENDRVVQIRFDSGHSCDISYDQALPTRIRRIVASDGHTLQYFYDSSNRLSRCVKDGADAESYAYDYRGYLAEVYDCSGRVVSRNAYDDFGQVVTAQSDTIVSPAGGKVSRTFRHNRLTSATDEAGVTMRLQYGDKGEVSAVQVGNRRGRGWRLTYDSTGRLKSLQDPDGRTTSLASDPSGKQIVLAGSQGDSRSFTLDDHGRLAAIVEPDGQRWSAKYDKVGRLSSVRGSLGERWDYRYAGETLQSIRGTSGEVYLKPRRNGVAIQAVAPNGTWSESVFDRAGRLTRHQTAGAKPVQLKYGSDHNTFSVNNEAGTVRYEIDEDDTAVAILFDEA